MKAIFLFLLFSFGHLSNSNSLLEKEVYICNGKSSTKYHLIKNCKGLERCSTEIEKITLSEAKKKKRTLCGWED